MVQSQIDINQLKKASDFRRLKAKLLFIEKKALMNPSKLPKSQKKHQGIRKILKYSELQLNGLSITLTNH